VLVTSVVEGYERIRTKSQEDAQRTHAGQFQSEAVEATEGTSPPATLITPMVLTDTLPPHYLSRDSTVTMVTLSSPTPQSEISDPGCTHGANGQPRLTDLANLGSHITFFSGAVDSLSVEAKANSRLSELDENSLLLDIPTRKVSRSNNLRKLKTLTSLSEAMESERTDVVRTESNMTSGGISDIAGDGFSSPVQRRRSSPSCGIQEELSVGEQTQQPAVAGGWAPISQSRGVVDPL